MYVCSLLTTAIKPQKRYISYNNTLKSYTKQLVAKIQKKYIVIFVLNRKRTFHCSIRLFVRQAKMQKNTYSGNPGCIRYIHES